MDGLTWALVAAVLVVLILVVLAVRKSRHASTVRAREEAAELREKAREQEWEVREREAKASQADAEARRIRAEADSRAAEAESAEVNAQRLAQSRDEAASAHEEQLRAADLRDPDVRTDREGRRLDAPESRPARGVGDEADRGTGGAVAGDREARRDGLPHDHESVRGEPGVPGDRDLRDDRDAWDRRDGRPVDGTGHPMARDAVDDGPLGPQARAQDAQDQQLRAQEGRGVPERAGDDREMGAHEGTSYDARHREHWQDGRPATDDGIGDGREGDLGGRLVNAKDRIEGKRLPGDGER